MKISKITVEKYGSKAYTRYKKIYRLSLVFMIIFAITNRVKCAVHVYKQGSLWRFKILKGTRNIYSTEARSIRENTFSML